MRKLTPEQPTKLKTTSEIIHEIRSVLTPRLIGSNSGTFGAAECCRHIGTGESRYGERSVFQTFTGAKFSTGPDEDEMPGAMRWFGASEKPVDLRNRLSKLKRELAQALQTETLEMIPGKPGSCAYDVEQIINKILREIR